MIAAIIRLLRPAQWLKNLLIFVPVIVSHRWQLNDLANCVLAFISFSLTASSLYIFNDLSDLDSDRKLASKAKRPLVTGEISIPEAIGLSIILLIISTWASLKLGKPFATVISVYILVTMFYTLWLKKVLILDILILATLLTVRVFAGAAVTGIIVSDWLLAFALFVFLSLATLKRASELIESQKSNLVEIPGRKYQLKDQQALTAMGFASAFASALILALYINSPDVKSLYSNPERLWLLVPIFIYWLCNLWFEGLRGKVDSDPVTYAAKQKNSYIVLILIAAVILYSMGIHWES
ncbi:MAG: UbiA family prenyltransferase [Bdellovibrionota bacterium]